MTQSAVLVSGGLDSVVLLATELAAGFDVWPVQIRAGLAWEDGEAVALDRLLRTEPLRDRARPLTTLTVDMRDVYPTNHWALSDRPPGYNSPDEAVYLPGRNIVLTAKTAVFAHERGIHRIALGLLAGNPFPDATPAFFDAMSRALSVGLAGSVTIATPLGAMHKADVIRHGDALGVRLELTMSCLRPRNDRHCGNCNKCRERREAFAAAGVEDQTAYGEPARP
jgi:7-cyano-7-deazaguanine synthase